MKASDTKFIFLFLCISLRIILTQPVLGQVIFLSVDDTTAVVDVPYVYQMDAYGEPDDIVFTLLEAPENMVISPAGEITWTPDSINDGGKVIVKATNSENESKTKEFYVYVAANIECLSSAEIYWSLDETLNEVNDSVFEDKIGNIDARVKGIKPVDTAGIVGIAQKLLPDNNSKITAPDNDIFDWTSDQSFSIEFMFKMNVVNPDSVGVIIGRNQGPDATDPHWWIGIDENSNLVFLVRTGAGEATVSISDFKDFNWHHVVAVKNAQTDRIALYVDGYSLPSDADSAIYDGTGPGFITNIPLCIGWLDPGDSPFRSRYPFNGKLDEMIIHNKALTVNEIKSRNDIAKAGQSVCSADNYAPVFKTMPKTTVYEDSLYTYQYLANDIDYDPLVYDTIIMPSWLQWNKTTRTLYGTPSNSDVGLSTVRIKVTDGNGNDIYQDFQITITGINDKPFLSAIEANALSYSEDDGDTIVSSTILVNDIDDATLDSARVWFSGNYISGEDSLCFTNTANITGTWNKSEGVLRLVGTTVKENYQNAFRSIRYLNKDTINPEILVRTVSYIINDGEFNSTPVSRNVAVSTTNDCPVITDHLTLNTPEDDTILIKTQYLIFNDVDNISEDIDLTVTTGSNYLYMGNIITPGLNYHGTINANVILNDGECDVEYSLPVTVTPVNDAPVFDLAGQSLDAYEKSGFIFTLRAYDYDIEDTVIYSIVQKPDWLSLIQDTILSGIPEFGDVGNNPVIIRITDNVDTIESTIFIMVHSTNYIPRFISIPDLSVNEDEYYSYPITVSDTNSSDILTVTAPVLPGWLSFDPVQQRLEGIPTNEYLGVNESMSFMVQLKVSDEKQDSTQTFSITVYNINDAPVITGQPDTIVSYPDSTLNLTISDILVEDVDNQNSDLKFIILPGAGYALNVNSITIKTYSAGILKVVVRVEDPDKLRDQDTLYIQVAIPSLINNPYEENSFVNVYPVPASDVIHFEIAESGSYSVEITNMAGTRVRKNMELIGKEVNTIDISALPNGLYFYTIGDKKVSFTGQFVISR